MRHRLSALLALCCLVTGMSFLTGPGAGAAPRPATVATSNPQLILFQGLDYFPPDRPAQVVDIYLAQDGAVVKEISDAYLGDVIDVNQVFPGYVKPGFFVIDVVKHGGNPDNPLLITAFRLKAGQSDTVATYFKADAAGTQEAPTIKVFTNDLSPTGGQARLTVYHLAVAPTVGVYADGSTALVPSFSNGMSGTVQVRPSAYRVTVTAPDEPHTVLFNVGRVALAPNTLTEAFAYGFYPGLFGVAAIQLPTT